MPLVIDRKTGEPKSVSSDELNAALSPESGYAPDPNEQYTMIDPRGERFTVPGGSVGMARLREMRFEGADARSQRFRDEALREYQQRPGKRIEAGVEAVTRGASFGLNDSLARWAGGQEAAEERRVRKEELGGLGTALEVAGALGPALVSGGASVAARGALATPAGLAGRLGTAVAGKGGSSIARMGAAAAVEGGLYEAGMEVSEVMLSDDPVTAERVMSALAEGGWRGAKFGGAAGVAVGALAKGLRRTGQKIRDAQEATTKGVTEPAEFTAKKAALADDMESAFKRAREEQPWEAITSDAWKRKVPGKKKPQSVLPRDVRNLSKKAIKLDNRLEYQLDNMKGLRENPARMKDVLEREQQIYEQILTHEDDVMSRLAAEGREGGRRAQAFGKIRTKLEQNAELQARLGDIIEEGAQYGKTAAKKGIVQEVVETGVQAATTGALWPVIGIGAAPVGSRVGQFAGDMLARIAPGLGKVSAKGAARTEAAINALAGAAEKAAPRAAIPTARVLSEVSFGGAKRAAEASSKVPHLSSYWQREGELRSLTEPGADGQMQATQRARREFSEDMLAVRAVDPLLADQMETTFARQVSFLSGKLLKRPDYTATGLGPSRWRPSNFELSQFARYVSAVKDPIGVYERASTGRVLPEEVEAIAAVYPEMHRDMTHKIMERMPKMKGRVGYRQRLALSILTGQPLDPAMEPQVIAMLQGNFAAEPNSEGGTVAPKAQPQFGSLRKSIGEPTPAQQRAG